MKLIPNGITVKPLMQDKNILVFADGRIYSLYNKKNVGFKGKERYWRIKVKGKNALIHSLIYQEFGDLPDDYCDGKYDIHHINGDRDNNHINNLECLNSSLHRSKGRKGKKQTEEAKIKMSEVKKGEKHPMYGRTGEKCPNSKLTDKQRIEIINKITKKNIKGCSLLKSFKEIANKYNVCLGTIRKLWYDFKLDRLRDQ